MSGFPTRPSLTSFGPKRANRSPVRDPNKDVGADFINLVRWNLAGLGQSSSRAWLLATYSSGITITAQGNAWEGAAPTISRTGAGVYVITYEETYVDADDQLIAPNFLAATVSPRAGANPITCDWSITSGRIITVRLFRSSTEAATDGSFCLVLF